jgi:ATP-dependent exoDNAse (exonuclease V) beta subunit
MTTLPYLTLIPAGAGSGKTYRIKEQLADWVETGLVKPDRIAAVTFTESAASELRERIRTTLMMRGRLEDALRLDQSFISTIHGFGRRLLVEYAFEAGNCPTPRLLAEDEEQLLLRKAIARIDRIEPLSRQLSLFGYRYDFPSGTTDVEQFRYRILSTIHMLRIIGGNVDRIRRLNHCLENIEQTYGPVDDATALTDALRRSVKTLLGKYPGCMSDFVDKPTPKAHLEGDFRNLQRAAQTDDLNENWGLWARLQGLKVYQNDNQLPADYQEMAREIIGHAEALCRHPGPLKDARLHGEVLFESAWDALSDYAQRKREKGIIDYTDMIDGARQLLDHAEVLEHLAGRFDCLVIDEFQDTNPLQFSLLWKLHLAGVPALIVGDLKQSIMGFQSADPRLMGNLIEQHRAQCAPLDSNWRSQAELMKVINAFGGQLFGKDYAPLTPKAPYKSNLHPLEVIHLEGTGIKNQTRAQHVAARVKDSLSDDKMTVFDRHSKKHRRIRGEDIAILGMTHARLKGYADALREIGIRARLAQDGWFMSREIQLAYYGLSFVADPQDRHAALYLAVTELGEDDLTSAVRTLLQGEELSLPLLQRLKDLSLRQGDLTVDELMTETLDAMALFDLASTWPDANQVRANLLRLIGEAQAFVAADREALAGGGYHGSGLKTFLTWLGSQLEGKDGDRQPDAQVHDEEAVQLLTWHAAKGKEWPVVFVTTLDRKVEGKLPSLDIQYTDFSDLDRILENARLQFSPSFTAAETNDHFKTPLDEKARKEGLNLLYVALTRAREQLILEWETNLQNSSRYTYWHLLRDVGNVKLEGNQLLIGEASFPCRVIAADREPPQGFEAPAAQVVPYLPRIGRRALKFGNLPDDLTPFFMTPSRLHGQEKGNISRTLKTIQYGQPLGLSLPSGADRGLLIHRALELMGQDISQEKAKKLMDLSVSDADWFKIQEMATSFTQCLHEQFKPTSLHWEVPITSKNRSGSVISGTIDLLVETKDGFWIIDHKSDEPQNMEETFNHYLPQLNSYAQALSEGIGLKVNSIAIHWPCLGIISAFSYSC